MATSSGKDAGTDSDVLMTIFGDQAVTHQFPLAHTKQGDRAVFEAGKSSDFEVDLDDVGTVRGMRTSPSATVDFHPLD